MNKKIVIGVVVVAIVVGILAWSPWKKRSIGQGGTGVVNLITDLTPINYTSSSTSPIRILNANYNRIYALIVNDSDTAMYIYPVNFSSTSTASTTVIAGRGIRLNANGGSYEIDVNNTYVGEVWLATSTAGKNVLVSEK